MIPRRLLETLSAAGRVFAIITALAIITIIPHSVLAQDTSSAIQQLKKHLNEAYTAAQNNDTAGVLVALDEANCILFFLELSTANMADSNMTSKTTTINTPTINPHTNNTDTNLLTWENPTYGIKFEYPSTWEKQEEEAGTMTTTLVNFLSPPRSSTDEFPEILNIGVEDLPTQSFTLEQYSELGINKLRTSLQDVNITESTDTTLAGSLAHKITYTFTFIDADNPSIQLPLKNMQVWTVNNGKAYVITYGGVVNQFSESLVDAQKIIDSFEILSGALTQPSITPFNTATTTLNTTTMTTETGTVTDNSTTTNTIPEITAEANIG